jgi:hypothetical protein
MVVAKKLEINRAIAANDRSSPFKAAKFDQA